MKNSRRERGRSALDPTLFAAARSEMNPSEVLTPPRILAHHEPMDGAQAESGGFRLPDFAALVGGIQAGDAGALEELYGVFGRGIRFFICRRLGPNEIDDRVHEIFLVVVEAIRRGEVREPVRLLGFIRTVMRRYIAAWITREVESRKGAIAAPDPAASILDKAQNPEDRYLARERQEVMRRILNGMPRRDRDVLIRFYLLEQTQEQICQEMRLTNTQFRLLKSRAKRRFTELGRRRLQPRE